MKIATITPSRGKERIKLLDHLRQQIRWQTIEVDHSIVVNYPPSEGFDLCSRVWNGIGRAKQLGMDAVVIMEDDDYYPSNYLEVVSKWLEKYDVVGFDNTIYYHIFANRYHNMHHPNRSSLFTTSFRLSALKGFIWPSDKDVFLDIKLWKHFNTFNTGFVPFSECQPIGIKHGIGLSGGMGHRNGSKFPHSDNGKKWLQKNVRPNSFDFYKSLK